MKTRYAVLGIAAAGLVAACAGAGSDGGAASAPSTTTTTTERPQPPFEITSTPVRLVDASRPTPANTAGVPESDERVLETTFTFPDAPGPFPLIAFAHGLAGHPRNFTQLFETWASAGYVVAAPAFPVSNDEVPGRPDFADLASQPGDISFVIDETLLRAEEPDGRLAGLVDRDRIGVAGLSLGGATAYGVAFNACCLDPRVDAVIVMDGARLAVGGEFDLANGTPLLIFHADQDPTLPYQDSENAYAEAVPPKYFVTIHERAHASPFEDEPDPADAMVEATTVAFWDAYLGSAEVDAIGDAASVEGLTTVQAEPG